MTATVTSYAEERVQTINQRIMSYTRLFEIVNRFNLYQELTDKVTTEEIVGRMREDIKFEPISAEILDRRTGRPTKATIAFSLSYVGKQPDTVQRVTSVLTSLFLKENLEVRQRQTRETSKFIEDEMDKVQADLSELDAKLAKFKTQHINGLPELLQVNQQSLHNIETSVERLNEQLRNLKERREYLQAQLATVSPHLGQEQKKRLEELKLQLAFLKSRFTDAYPDVVKVRAEISEIEDKSGMTEQASDFMDDRPDNPAYITLTTQLATTQTDIDSIDRQIETLIEKAAEYRHRIIATPKVEETYKAILIEQENTRAKYEDLMRKLMEARVAHGLELDQKGERFTLIEPARLPKKPYKPNRPLIILIGLVLGIGFGGAAAYLRETMDRTVRNTHELSLVTESPVLAGIPVIETSGDLLRKRMKRFSVFTVVVLAIFGGLAAFHYLVMDLNMFWVKVMQRMTL